MTSFRKCHILQPEDSSPKRDSNPCSSIGGRLRKQTCKPLHHASPQLQFPYVKMKLIIMIIDYSLLLSSSLLLLLLLLLQVFVFHNHEPQLPWVKTSSFRRPAWKSAFNWTMTYRSEGLFVGWLLIVPATG